MNRNVLVSSSTDNELCSSCLHLSKHEKSSQSNLCIFVYFQLWKLMLIRPLKIIQKIIYWPICNWYLCEIHIGQSLSVYNCDIYIILYLFVYMCVCVWQSKLGYQTLMMTRFHCFWNYYICNGGRMSNNIFFKVFKYRCVLEDIPYTCDKPHKYQLITGWLVDRCMVKLHQLFIKKKTVGI